jgi:hypothetical protein
LTFSINPKEKSLTAQIIATYITQTIAFMKSMQSAIIPVKPNVINNPSENCLNLPHSAMLANPNRFDILALT